jgi:peptide/nickel transport system substrate-binding protein
VKHIRWQALITVIGIAFLSVVLILLGLTANTTEQPDYGGTYVEGVVGKPSILNPIYLQSDTDRDIAALVFNGLTRSDETGAIKPDLAARYNVSPDGLVYTFTVRSDVRWEDGARFTADDVLFTIRAIQDPAYRVPADLAAFWRTVAVTQTDALTVRFQLTQIYAPFLHYTTIGILPAHLLKDVAPGELIQHPFNRKPIGTGPFFVSDSSADYILLDANTRYFGTKPYLARVQFRFYPDYDAIFAAYARNEVQGIARILPNQLAKARAQPSLRTFNARIAGYTLIYLNLAKPQFQDARVRQALLYAIDRKKVVNDLQQGQGLVALSPIEPESWAYDTGLNPYLFDPERAKALLDAAGFKDSGDGIRRKDQTALQFTLTTNDDPARISLANEIARTWQTVGVRVTVQPATAAQIVPTYLRPRNYDAVLSEYRTLSNDPDQYENWHQSQISGAGSVGQNYSGLNDRDISEVLEAARRTNDQGKRADLYRRFQELFSERVPALVLFYPVYTFGIDTRVRGAQLAPLLTPSDRFRTLTQWYLKTKRITTNLAPLPTATPLPDDSN